MEEKLIMAQKKPYNSWASARQVGSVDGNKAKRNAEVVAIAQWAKGKGDLPEKTTK